MKFEWDEAKCRLNIRNHGIDFKDVPSVFDSPMLTAHDSRMEYGEERWVGIGQLRGVVVVVVVFTERGEDVIRIISARKALKHEREKYFEKIKDEMD
jgi:uncharacterized DUF497 family protein